MDGMEDSMFQSLISMEEDSRTKSIQDMNLMNYLTRGEGSCTLVNEVEDIATPSASATSAAPEVSDRNGNLPLSMTSAGSDCGNPPLASASNGPVTGEITSMVSAGSNRNNPVTSSTAFSSDTSDTPYMMSAGFDSTYPPVTSTCGSDTGDITSMTAADSNSSVCMTVAGSSSADPVLLSTSSGSDGSSNPIESMMPADSTKKSDAPIVTGRQTRSKTVSVSKLCSETIHDKEKSKRSLTNKKNVAADTLLPVVLLHDIGSHNEPKDDSAKKSLDVPSSDNSDEPGVLDRHSDEENHLCNSGTTSNSQRKVNKQGRQLVTPRRKSTEAGKDQTSVTSVRILRINRSSGSNLSDDLERAVEEHKRRNAESAKESRLKKKIYVENLEQEVEDDRKKIDELESYVNRLEVERKELIKEIHYLKAVLANQSALALLLKNIPDVSCVARPSSFSRKRSADVDSCSAHPAKKPFGKSTGSGVCLHVDSGSVSLEVCHRCAEMAQGDMGTK